jgi:predicted 2-oxoglutarate/Fe(II)-dependent dioxygenase YbiX
MSEVYTRTLLNREEITEIRSIIREADWGSSNRSLPEYLESCQTNSEMLEGPGRRRIHEIIFNALNKDQGFIDQTHPDHSTYITISRTSLGQGFAAHHDLYKNGDFSTTVFLSNPCKYKGGRLRLKINEDTQEFALPAGDAITYSSGVPHCVSKVEEGVRYAAIFWTASSIKDPRLREILTGIRTLKRTFPPYSGFSLEKAIKDPNFILSGVENNLLRYLYQEGVLTK